MNYKDKNGKKLNIGDYFCYRNDYYKIIDCDSYTGYEKVYEPESKPNIKYIAKEITKIPYDEIRNNHSEWCL